MKTRRGGDVLSWFGFKRNPVKTHRRGSPASAASAVEKVRKYEAAAEKQAVERAIRDVNLLQARELKQANAKAARLSQTRKSEERKAMFPKNASRSAESEARRKQFADFDKIIDADSARRKLIQSSKSKRLILNAPLGSVANFSPIKMARLMAALDNVDALNRPRVDARQQSSKFKMQNVATLKATVPLQRGNFYIDGYVKVVDDMVKATILQLTPYKMEDFFLISNHELLVDKTPHMNQLLLYTAEYNFQVVHSVADGTCLLNSFLMALSPVCRRLKDKSTHSEITARQIVGQAIRRQLYAELQNTKNTRIFEEPYGEYMEENALVYFCRIFKVNALVNVQNLYFSYYEDKLDKSRPFMMMYCNGGHFDVMKSNGKFIMDNATFQAFKKKQNGHLGIVEMPDFKQDLPLKYN